MNEEIEKYQSEIDVMLTKLSSSLALELAKKKDELIAKHITHLIGPGWVLNDVMPLLSCNEDKTTGRAIYFFDQIPMLAFYPTATVQRMEENQPRMTASLNYRSFLKL